MGSGTCGSIEERRAQEAFSAFDEALDSLRSSLERAAKDDGRR
jgi:hypothetical protein